MTVSDNNYNPDNISAETVFEKKKFIADESEELWNLAQELIELSVDKGLYL